MLKKSTDKSFNMMTVDGDTSTNDSLFLLANGALNDGDTLDIRKKLIQNDKVEDHRSAARTFHHHGYQCDPVDSQPEQKGRQLSRRALRNREHEILFMDLRQWTENPVKGEGKKKVLLDTDQIDRAAGIYHTWQNEGTDGASYAVPELYRSVGIDEIEQNGWALTPSKYI